MVIQCLLLGKLHTVLVGTILTEMYTVSDAIAVISIWITEHVCSVRAFLSSTSSLGWWQQEGKEVQEHTKNIDG